MATYREIVYIVLDEIKSSNGDSDITQEHVIFLANQYRLFLLEQKKKKDGESSLSPANEQTICLTLKKAQAIPGLDYCNEVYLKSEEEIPPMVDENNANVYIHNPYSIMTALVSRNRFKFVGNNKYMKNIIYCTLGDDNHLYFKSVNPLFRYLKTAKLTGIFEDSLKAADLVCDSTGSKCDILDLDFPLQADLIPPMIELIVKELLGANYRPEDSTNDDTDNLAEIANFIRSNVKSPLAKSITE